MMPCILNQGIPESSMRLSTSCPSVMLMMFVVINPETSLASVSTTGTAVTDPPLKQKCGFTLHFRDENLKRPQKSKDRGRQPFPRRIVISWLSPIELMMQNIVARYNMAAPRIEVSQEEVLTKMNNADKPSNLHQIHAQCRQLCRHMPTIDESQKE